MASHPSDGTNANPVPAETRTEILQELVETTSSAVNAQFDAFTTRLADALLQASSRHAEPAEAKRCRDAADLLKKNRYPFYYLASARLLTVLQHEVQAAEDPSLGDSNAGRLKPLPPDLEIDRKLTLAKTGRAIEYEHGERLAALGIRLAHLLGRPGLETRQNPFRPHIFLSVIHDAWCEFQPDEHTHHLVFPLLQPDVFLDMAPILHALNATLVRRGVLPRLAASHHIETSRPDEAAGGDGLARQLRRLFADETGRAPAMAGGFPALFSQDMLHAATARDKLLAYVASQRNSRSDAALLARIRQQAPQDTLTGEDERVFELLTTIFAALFRDEHLPAELRALLGSLQVPVLEAALTDKDFFFSKDHPARRLIELLAQLGAGWDSSKDANDPLHQAILRNVKRVQSDRRIAVFFDAVADLEAFAEKEASLSAEALSATIAHALRQEKQQQAAKAASQEVALRIGTGEVVAFVETFLEDKWVAVLTLAYSVKDEKPQAVQSALQTMDDLIWSVKPKITAEERKELLAMLPPLLARLNKWLDVIKWDDLGRAQFFAELAKCHASIMRAPLKLSPQRQVELALAAAQRAAERRMKRQAKAPVEPAPDEFALQAQALERGSWLAFARKNGSELKVQLAWISPMRNYYIFATRERQEALSLTAETLAQALRSRRAHILVAAGLVERALNEALGTPSANGDSIAPQSAA